MPRTCRKIAECFERAGRRVELIGGGACIVVIPDGARVVALSFDLDSESVMFANPGLDELVRSGKAPVELPGGPGGARIRFAPELAYAWGSGPQDVDAFSNYAVQATEDPGNYRMLCVGGAVSFGTKTQLVDNRDGTTIRFAVERTITAADSPLEGVPQGVRFAGFVSRATITLQEAEPGKSIDLWHLVQVPIHSTLVVPVTMATPPVPYFNFGAWTLRERCLTWRCKGIDNAKIGYRGDLLTGKVGAIRQREDGAWILLVLKFPVMQDAYYCDAPEGLTPGDQVFQAWDGFGFGELEYHTPAVGAPPLPGHYDDVSELWAFEGPLGRIEEIMQQLLGLTLADVGDVEG